MTNVKWMTVLILCTVGLRYDKRSLCFNGHKNQTFKINDKFIFKAIGLMKC